VTAGRLMAYKIWLGVNRQRELRHATHGNINHVQAQILLTHTGARCVRKKIIKKYYIIRKKKFRTHLAPVLTHGIAVNTSHTDTFNY
jgi:hypothetical protein